MEDIVKIIATPHRHLMVTIFQSAGTMTLADT